MRPTVLEISIENFKYNLEQIQKYVGDNVTLMPVIKAEAYGTFLNQKLDLIKDFKIVAVAIADEGAFLRSIGFENEIFILNQPSSYEIDTIVKNNLSVGVASLDFVRDLNAVANKNNKIINVHLEIETGMNRTGFFLPDLKNSVNELLSFSNINVEGLYSHLSSADENDEYSKLQFSKFLDAKHFLENKFNFKYVHLSASSGILNYSELDFNTVRPGIIMYGFESFDGSYKKIDLRPVAKLKSKITFIKDLPASEKVGYSGSFILEKDSRIATVPIGYADGMDRSLSNNGFVVVNDSLVPIVGKVCMDSFMIDVSNVTVSVGDDVYVWDNSIQTLENISEKAGTINYEFLSRISKRVPRVFI